MAEHRIGSGLEHERREGVGTRTLEVRPLPASGSVGVRRGEGDAAPTVREFGRVLATRDQNRGYELYQIARNPLFLLEPPPGVEPGTYSLRVSCSTN